MELTAIGAMASTMAPGSTEVVDLGGSNVQQVLRRFLASLFLVGWALLVPLTASASLLTQTLTQIGGNTWAASFTVANEGPLAAIESFTIYLDFQHATQIALLSSPSTWDSLVIQPDLGLGADGFLDALVLDSADAIRPGQEQAGFAIRFDWSGNGTPGSFEFTVNDPATFEALETGRTVTTAVASVPEPGVLGLVLLGTLGAVQFRRRH